MISSFQVWTSVGTLVGTIVDNFTSKILTRESYLIPLGIIFVVPLFMSIGLIFIPESPRWLLEHGHREKALKSLLWHRPYGQRGAEEELRDIQEALESETQLKQSAGVKDLFANPVDRRRTVLAILGITLQGASGAMYMIGTLPYPSRPSPLILLSIHGQIRDRHLLTLNTFISIWNVLLRNRKYWRQLRELMHPDGRRCHRHPDQQCRDHTHRSSPRVPDHRHVLVRPDAAPHCGGLHHQSRDGIDWPGHCWTRSCVHRWVQRKSLSPAMVGEDQPHRRLIGTC